MSIEIEFRSTRLLRYERRNPASRFRIPAANLSVVSICRSWHVHVILIWSLFFLKRPKSRFQKIRSFANSVGRVVAIGVPARPFSCAKIEARAALVHDRSHYPQVEDGSLARRGFRVLSRIKVFHLILYLFLKRRRSTFTGAKFLSAAWSGLLLRSFTFSGVRRMPWKRVAVPQRRGARSEISSPCNGRVSDPSPIRLFIFTELDVLDSS